MNARISIRRLTIAELREERETLSKLEGADRWLGGLPESHVEFLATNPRASEEDLCLILAMDGETIVGRLELIAGRGLFEGAETKLYCLSGFFLDAKYRQTGVGGMMIFAALGFSKHLLGAGGPSAELRKLYRVLGFIELPRLKQFVAFPSPRPLLTTVIGATWVTSAAAWILKPISRAWYALHRLSVGRQSAGGLEFEPVSRLPAALDEVLAARTGNRFPKTVADLNWVVDWRKSLSAFIVRRDAKIVGYCILKTEEKPFRAHARFKHPMRLATLKDHYVAELSDAEAVQFVQFCWRKAIEDDAEVLMCQVQSTLLEAAYRRHGFLPYGGSYVFYRPPGDREKYENAEWCLSAWTGDMIL